MLCNFYETQQRGALAFKSQSYGASSRYAQYRFCILHIFLLTYCLVIMMALFVMLLGSQVVLAELCHRHVTPVLSDKTHHSTSAVSLHAAFVSCSPQYQHSSCPSSTQCSTCPANLSTVGHDESSVGLCHRHGVSESPPTELVFHAPELAEETLLDVRHSNDTCNYSSNY